MTRSVSRIHRSRSASLVFRRRRSGASASAAAAARSARLPASRDAPDGSLCADGRGWPACWSLPQPDRAAHRGSERSRRSADGIAWLDAGLRRRDARFDVSGSRALTASTPPMPMTPPSRMLTGNAAAPRWQHASSPGSSAADSPAWRARALNSILALHRSTSKASTRVLTESTCAPPRALRLPADRNCSRTAARSPHIAAAATLSAAMDNLTRWIRQLADPSRQTAVPPPL